MSAPRVSSWECLSGPGAIDPVAPATCGDCRRPMVEHQDLYRPQNAATGGAKHRNEARYRGSGRAWATPPPSLRSTKRRVQVYSRSLLYGEERQVREVLYRGGRRSRAGLVSRACIYESSLRSRVTAVDPKSAPERRRGCYCRRSSSRFYRLGMVSSTRDRSRGDPFPSEEAALPRLW